MSHALETLEGRRLFAGGALDTTFATGGSRSLTFRVASATDVVTPLQVLTAADGHVYVTARSQGTFQVRRLTADGAIDSAWGRHGLLVFSTVGTTRELARLDHAGRLDVLIGKKISRYTTAGAADATFGTGGTADLSGTFGQVNDFAFDSGDRVYVVGDVPTKTRDLDRAGVVRLISRGKADRTFQAKGVYVVPQIVSKAKNESQATADFVRVLADDSVVVAGTVGFGTQNGTTVPQSTAVRAFKLTPDGVSDTTYGQSGVTIASPHPDNELYTFSLDAIGIRANGAVALDGRTSGDDGPGDVNQEIKPDGQFVGFDDSSNTVEYADLTNSYYEALTSTTFTTLPDGRELATVLGGGVSVLTAGGGYDHTFNDGNIVELGSERYGNTGVAAAGTADDKIVAIKVGKGRTEIVVRQFLTTGQGTSPADPAAVPPPMAGGRHLTTPSTSLRFNVSYQAPIGRTIDVSTIGPAALRVFGPNGGHRAPRLVEVLSNNGQYVNAAYRVTDVDGSDFTAADNGTYTVRLLPNTVKYDDGTFVDGQVIGTLTVKIV